MPDKSSSVIPADDPLRPLAMIQPNKDPKIRHIGVVGDTYILLLTGKETAGRFCLIDMFVPPGGGPPPHRHDFEETFTLLEGELDVVFCGAKQVVRAGETIHVPANAPHQFHNSSTRPVRMLCICSPAGQEEFFLEIGVPVATRTTPPPELDPAAHEARPRSGLDGGCGTLGIARVADCRVVLQVVHGVGPDWPGEGYLQSFPPFCMASFARSSLASSSAAFAMASRSALRHSSGE